MLGEGMVARFPLSQHWERGKGVRAAARAYAGRNFGSVIDSLTSS